MDFSSVLLVAIGLSMDAFAVSVSSGLIIKNLKARHAALIGLFFGGFQFFMPLVGWFSGTLFRDLISAYDHWIAFGLLFWVGARMVCEGFGNEEARTFDPLKLPVLFMLAVATSVDAFAVGLGFSVLRTAIFRPALIIGVVTFTISFMGVYIGDRIGHLSERKVEVLGGLILIGIGVKILMEHMK
jgi:putative Mn2+ efflux pump MntP